MLEEDDGTNVTAYVIGDDDFCGVLKRF